ncbi:MAG: hypothetical protein ACI80L_001613 [Pseudohongiellaceae bacterium]|jgi:hypothetical protein
MFASKAQCAVKGYSLGKLRNAAGKLQQFGDQMVLS